MIRPITRVTVLALILFGLGASGVLVAQNRRALTTADYDRAVKMLSQNTNPLVDHDAKGVTWLDDKSFVWFDNDANGVGQKAAGNCKRVWTTAGRTVVTLIPKQEGWHFNDVILRQSAA